MYIKLRQIQLHAQSEAPPIDCMFHRIHRLIHCLSRGSGEQDPCRRHDIPLPRVADSSEPPCTQPSSPTRRPPLPSRAEIRLPVPVCHLSPLYVSSVVANVFVAVLPSVSPTPHSLVERKKRPRPAASQILGPVGQIVRLDPNLDGRVVCETRCDAY
jgi:hypothetical protein